MARQFWRSGRLFLLVLLLSLFFCGAARPDPPNADLTAARDLEQSIRDSENLGLLTKLGIQIRFERIKSLRESVGRGDVSERSLKLAFDSTFDWLEGVFADDAPVLHLRLLRARPALWRIATDQRLPVKRSRRTAAGRELRGNR